MAVTATAVWPTHHLEEWWGTCRWSCVVDIVRMVRTPSHRVPGSLRGYDQCAAGSRATPWGSAPVALHDLGVTDLRGARVLTELAPGAALPQQVPALVQLDLDAPEPLVLLLAADLAGPELRAQPVLLLDQPLDACLDVDVVGHPPTIAPGSLPREGCWARGRATPPSASPRTCT